jgi:O-antigen ligase
MRFFAVAGLVLWGGAAIAATLFEPLLLLALFGGTILLGVLVVKPILAIYLMAATYPFIALEIVIGPVNAPVVDYVATAAIAGVGMRYVINVLRKKVSWKSIQLWGLPLFAVWAGVSLLTAFNSVDVMLSLQYAVRVLIFFYIAFVWTPLHVIQKPHQLSRVMTILFIVGVLIALYGLYGFVVSDAATFLERRVVPVPLFGFNPLGTNHNLIADVMVTTLPIGFFLMQYQANPQRQKILFLGLAVMLLAVGLTFSRSGWLALAVEMAVLVGLMYRHHLRAMINYGAIAAAIASPVIVYMLVFSSQSAVESSNVNRLLLNEIALEMFTEQPLLGEGPGTFLPTVGSNYVYIQEFGAPLDAHGFIQKIAAEMGVLGLVAFIALMGYVFRKLYTEYQRFILNDVSAYLLASLLMTVVGSFFFQLFQTSYFVGKLWFPVGVALAAVAITQRELDSMITPSNEDSSDQ